MSDFDEAWKKLVAAARQAPSTPDESAPFGFSTRVAAMAFEPERSAQSPFARLALRAAAVACLLAVIAVGVNFSAIKGAFEDEPTVAGNDDAITEVVDLAS